MQLPFTVKLDTFLCPDFRCSDCGWSGVLEVKTTAFSKKDVESKVFKFGDHVVEGWVGKKEVFDGAMCPQCLERGLVKILPVVLLFLDGVFMRADF